MSDNAEVILYHPQEKHYTDILAEKLNTEPSKLKLGYHFFGKPYLMDHSLYFNVSHKRDMAAIIIYENSEVGIDIEDLNYQIRAHRKVLHENESCQLLSLSDGERHQATMRIFCMKEALLKALGFGISFPMTNLDLSMSWQEEQFIFLKEYFVQAYLYKTYLIATATKL